MLQQIPSHDELSNASTTDNTFHLPKYNVDIKNVSRCHTFLPNNPHDSDIHSHNKKRSKISLFILSQNNKEIDDYKNAIADLSQCDLLEECNEHLINSNCMESVNIYKNVEIFYYICLYGIDFVMKSCIHVYDNATINEVLCLAVKQFNSERFKINMEKGDCYVSIKESEKEDIWKGCELREVKKKTMLPKMDWPAYYGEAKMKDLNVERFSFVIKDYKMVSLIKNSIWNDKKCITINDENAMKKETKCLKGCLIM